MTDADRLAGEAWIFGYPLVLTDMARRVAAAQGQPPNTFQHVRTFPHHTFTDLVMPNADTLYSSAWLDLRAEPVVLSLPATGSRYVLMPLVSASTEVFAALGSRTTGVDGGEFAICGPGWTGELPDGVARIDAPTATVSILARTSTGGTRDYLAVHALQDSYLLIPLSEYVLDAPSPGAVDPLPAAAATTAPVDQVARLDGPAFFDRLAELLVDNPPAPADEPMLQRLAELGVRPGEPLVGGAAIAAGPSVGQAILRQTRIELDVVNGWSIVRGLGRYGTDYALRAAVALQGLGGNLDLDAVHPRASLDADGQPLGGGHQYVVHFDAGEVPPVRGFWSLTVYNDKQSFVDNSLDRYAIGDRDPLVYAEDGSLDIWVQPDDPGPEFQSNWLPAPTGSFTLSLRTYWPEPSIIDGTWNPPPIRRLD
jgi:hypothetical protein